LGKIKYKKTTKIIVEIKSDKFATITLFFKYNILPKSAEKINKSVEKRIKTKMDFGRTMFVKYKWIN
jgi:hypothetical protein